MAKKYMSQNIYDAGVSMIGYLHKNNQISISDSIYKVRGYYEDNIIDDGGWEEMGNAVVDYLSYIDEFFAKKEMEGILEGKNLSYSNMENKKNIFLNDYKEYCMAYRSDGKKKGFFSGMMFMKSEKIANKKENFFKRTEKYLEKYF